MRYEQAQDLPPQEFKRLFGVKRYTFEWWSGQCGSTTHLRRKTLVILNWPLKTSSRRPQYWREDRTYFHIAQDWGHCRNLICHRTVPETVLMRSGRFSTLGKERSASGWFWHYCCGCYRVSVNWQVKSSSPVASRSGIPSSLNGDWPVRTLLCTAHGKGRRHDLWKAASGATHPRTKGLGDRGYQGLRN